MNVGTKSILFGVHQFLIHPIFVARAWWIIYRQWPKLHEWAAITTHDLGYWGASNMDGPEGESHPARMAAWWYKHFGDFGDKVAAEILGHSRFHAASNGLPLSKLFQPDKLASALYPKWFYLLLGNASGEIEEYMYMAEVVGGSQLQWLIEVQAHMALMGLQGDDHVLVKEQMNKGNTMKTEIKLNAHEIQSNLNRVKAAEGLIKQLPETHDGRNTWLMNYGVGEIAQAIRANDAQKREDAGYKPRVLAWDDKTESLEGFSLPRRQKEEQADTNEGQTKRYAYQKEILDAIASMPKGIEVKVTLGETEEGPRIYTALNGKDFMYDGGGKWRKLR